MAPAKLLEEGPIDDDLLQPQDRRAWDRMTHRKGLRAKEVADSLDIEGRTVQAAAQVP